MMHLIIAAIVARNWIGVNRHRESSDSMASIWVTGDTHGVVSRLEEDIFYEQLEMTDGQDNNFVIILGDFGLVWNRETEGTNEKFWLDWLEKRPFTTLFIDGNHENYDRLYNYPVEDWHGGKVHKIRPHVIHLMRGEIFDILGKKFFAFGGARSHDIRDGVLELDDERINTWRYDYSKLFRINHLSWWKEEMPSEEERQNGIKNLEKYNHHVDYILTHEIPASVTHLINSFYKVDDFGRFLEDIRCDTIFKRWFSGHYHINREVNDQNIIFYEQIIRIL